MLEPLADDHSSDSDDAPTGVEESAAPAAPAAAAAPKRAAMSLRERLQEHTTIMTALCLCVVRKMKGVVHNPGPGEPGYELSVTSARVHVRVNRVVVVCCCTFFAGSIACTQNGVK